MEQAERKAQVLRRPPVEFLPNPIRSLRAYLMATTAICPIQSVVQP